mgnify:CR=1 FL=1
MNDKALRILEYHKIINLLIDKATSLPGKEVCKKLTPMIELAAIEDCGRFYTPDQRWTYPFQR